MKCLTYIRITYGLYICTSYIQRYNIYCTFFYFLHFLNITQASQFNLLNNVILRILGMYIIPFEHEDFEGGGGGRERNTVSEVVVVE